nr:MAG: hypothetical protein [Microvirus sp.]
MYSKKYLSGSHFEWYYTIMENEMKLKKYSFARDSQSKGEINSGETLVDTVGYVSNKRRIQALEKAGKRLINFRMLNNTMYDTKYGEDPADDLIVNPLRQKGFDFSDASMILNAIEAKIKNVRRKLDDENKNNNTPKDNTDTGEQKPTKNDSKDNLEINDKKV